MPPSSPTSHDASSTPIASSIPIAPPLPVAVDSLFHGNSYIPPPSGAPCPPVEAVLCKTRPGKPALGTVHAFTGIVAAPGFSQWSVFTTPNADWVPEFAIAHGLMPGDERGRG
ncbi:hypothetical protein K466DRAFT_604168 [Polyporus arcularius HHB13444]|uniref:Uncharacterized protein n=1 Tax=Polyporus arcularius HHB13444 TaxID=1314778 RepID=A0A5C3P0L7_9APHY|nr:hypothetical protein K466DRAFT_604168 [Polyporus arcularius HHB13444]